MNTAQMDELLADHRRLAVAMADPERLAALPQTPATLAALPLTLAPFQARWLFGHITDDTLKIFREVHPAIVAQKFGSGSGVRYRYSKLAICKAANIPFKF